MPRKDLHEKAFDETTLTKLDIFEKYLEEWLPVFLFAPFRGEIQIWDFFAGQGYDIKGQKGSPVRILDCIKKFEADILRSGRKIRVILNEADNEKIDRLKEAVQQYLGTIPSVKMSISIEIYAEEFQRLYKTKYSQLQKGNNLIFLDQNGVKEITEKVFLELVSFPTTDFLFFISSSYFIRFADDFQKIHTKLDLTEIRNSQYKKLHISVLNLYKIYLREARKENIYLFPFSLLKPTASGGYNIYGLIFCAKHILAAQKFLTIAWDKNKLNGQANYDIENDKAADQMDLFTGQKAQTKIEKFQKEFGEAVLAGQVSTNLDALVFTLGAGHIPSHAEDVIKKLKKDGLIEVFGSSGINYSAYKGNSVTKYKSRRK
jgi:three-Cys-motif partner protein